MNKEELFHEYEQELRMIWKGKPYRSQHNSLICKIIDLTLNNFCKGERKNGNKINRYLAFSKTVNPKDEQEYKEMYSEILAVIRKHNRELKL